MSLPCPKALKNIHLGLHGFHLLQNLLFVFFSCCAIVLRLKNHETSEIEIFSSKLFSALRFTERKGAIFDNEKKDLKILGYENVARFE